MLDKHFINYGASQSPVLLFHPEPGIELFRDPHPLVPILHSGLGN